MKLGEVLAVKDAVKKIVTVELPVKIAYHLSKMTDTFFDEVGHIENFRINLLKEYGEEDNGSYVVPNEKKEEFISKYNELLEQEYEGMITSIDLETLLETNVQLTPIEMRLLIEVGIVTAEEEDRSPSK